jgi:uncharacterized protein
MDNFKWSRYNFLVKTRNSSFFLYNSFSNALIKIDESFYNDLTSLSLQKQLPNGKHEFSSEEIDFLHKNYVLVENDDDLIDIMEYQSFCRLFSRKHLVITIVPTQSCNFNCAYCFEKWRSSGNMDDNTANSILN